MEEEKKYLIHFFKDDLSFLEVDRMEIEGKTYALLFQCQKPNAIIAGEVLGDKVKIVETQELNSKVISTFLPDDEAKVAKFKPIFDDILKYTDKNKKD